MLIIGSNKWRHMGSKEGNIKISQPDTAGLFSISHSDAGVLYKMIIDLHIHV